MIMLERLPYGSSIKAKLEAYSIPEPNSGCWLWLGTTIAFGYGRIWIDGIPKLAHRLAYEEYIRPIPDGLLVLHRCDTPLCINPNHLKLGTYQDNSDDVVQRGRHNSGLGETARAAKITNEIVIAIASDLLKPGLTHAGIGENHGISGSLISAINSGRRWSHITNASPENKIRTGRAPALIRI